MSDITLDTAFHCSYYVRYLFALWQVDLYWGLRPSVQGIIALPAMTKGFFTMKLQAPTRLFAYDQPGLRICRLCFGSPISHRQVQHSVVSRK